MRKLNFDEYNLNHVPEEYRPKAIRHLLKCYTNWVSSDYWVKLQEDYKNDFKGTTTYIYSINAYKQEKSVIDRLKAKLTALQKIYPEYLV